MLDDLDFERDDRIERRIGDFWPVAAVDRGIGGMDKEGRVRGRLCRLRSGVDQGAWPFSARCRAGLRLEQREG